MESSIKDMHWHTMTYRAPVWAERVKFIFCLPQLSDEHASASFERLSWLLKQRRINIFIARCGFVSKDWRRVFSNVCSLASVELRKKQLQYLWAFAESICEYFFLFMCIFALEPVKLTKNNLTLRFIPFPSLTPFPCAGIFQLCFPRNQYLSCNTCGISKLQNSCFLWTVNVDGTQAIHEFGNEVWNFAHLIPFFSDHAPKDSDFSGNPIFNGWSWCLEAFSQAGLGWTTQLRFHYHHLFSDHSHCASSTDPF